MCNISDLYALQSSSALFAVDVQSEALLPCGSDLRELLDQLQLWKANGRLINRQESPLNPSTQQQGLELCQNPALLLEFEYIPKKVTLSRISGLSSTSLPSISVAICTREGQNSTPSQWAPVESDTWKQGFP